MTVTNRQTSSMLIHKIDAVTGEGIYGVTFLVSDAKHNPIGQYTSDQNGYVYIDRELKDGKYYVQEIQPAEGYLVGPYEENLLCGIRRNKPYHMEEYTADGTDSDYKEICG